MNKFFTCDVHPVADLWLPLSVVDVPEHYRCMLCKPPPAKAFIAKVAKHRALGDATESEAGRMHGHAPGNMTDRAPSHARGGKAERWRAIAEAHAEPHAMLPPSPSLEAKQVAASEAESDGPIIVAYDQPICLTCHCTWAVEVDQPDGLTVRCWSCKRELSQERINEITNQPTQHNIERLLPFHRWYLQQHRLQHRLQQQ